MLGEVGKLQDSRRLPSQQMLRNESFHPPISRFGVYVLQTTFLQIIANPQDDELNASLKVQFGIGAVFRT